MKRSKIILRYSFYLISFIYVFIIINNKIVFYKYSNENKIEGVVTSYQKYDDYYVLDIKGKEKVRCYYYGDLNIKLGIKVEAIGEMSLPNPNTNFHLYNYQNYLLSKKIYHLFYIKKLKIINSNPNIFYKIKNYLKDRINKSKNKDYLNLFITGENNLGEMKDIFQELGISHLFAISGMHITLLTSILYKILNKISKKKKLNFYLISLFLFFYMFLTNYTASVLRASFLFILINTKNIHHFKIDNLVILLCLFFVLLDINPYYIYDLGFLFSFTISYALIKYNRLINRFNNYFIKIFITSLISFVFSIPIIILNIYSINLLSPFLNCIFVPFVSLIVFPLVLICLVFTFINPVLSLLINILEGLAKFFITFKIELILPWVNIYVVFLYFIFINFLFKKVKLKKIILFLIILFIHSNINYFCKTNITFLDIGQGDSTLISLKHNQGNILIDTGGNYNKDLATSIIIPVLKSKGIKKLDYLILTHGDFDHMGEAINVINNFKVEKVIFNIGTFNSSEQALIKLLNKKHIPYYQNINNLKVGNLNLEFLNTKDYNDENENSNVIYFKVNKYKFLFMGDAGQERELDIIKKYNLKNFNVLKVGHHGSRTSSNETFIATIKPIYSIISVGKNNKFNHPNKETLNTLKKSKIFRTDIDGSIKFTVGDNLKIEKCVK